MKTKNLLNKKITQWLLLVAMLVGCSASAYAATTYYYRGEDNSWGATAMTASTDGYYCYIQSSNSANQFKIAKTTTGYDYNKGYVSKGFNSTNVQDIGDYGGDNCYCWYKSGTYYIILYYPDTDINTSSNPKICASTTLPLDARCYDGTEYLYFDVSASWFGNDGAVPYVSFDGGSSYTDATKVAGKIYKILVPEGCYTSFKVKRHTGSYTGDEGTISDVASSGTKNEIVTGDWGSKAYSWSTFAGCGTAANFALGGYLNKTDVGSYDNAWKLDKISDNQYSKAFTFTYVHNDSQYLWIIGDDTNKWGVSSNTPITLGGSQDLQFNITDGKVQAPCTVGQEYLVTFNVDAANCQASVTWASGCTPPAAPTITGNTDVCSGSTTTLTSGNQYTKWYIGGVEKYTGKTYTTDVISGNITVEAKAYISDEESCLSDATQKNITKKDKPAQPGEISGGSILCANQTYSNRFSISSVSTATSYTWTKVSGNLSVTGNGTQCSVTTNENYDGGTIQVVAVNDCGNSTARTLTLTKTADPTVSLSASEESVCAGSNVTITAATTNVNTYSWIVAGWKEVSKDENQAVYTTTGSGATTITYTGTNTCNVSKSGSTTVTVIEVPTAGTVSATVTSMCLDGSSTLSTTGTSGATSYQWQKSTTSASDGFENISGATNATYTVSGLTAGSYWFRLVVKNGGNCSGTSNAVPVTVNPAPNLSVTVSSTAITAGETDKTYGWEPATFTASSSTDGASITGGVIQTTGTGGIIEDNKAKGHVGDAFTGSYTATKGGCSTDAQKTVTVIKAEEVCQ
ncbi:MAG: hypothetical protein MJ007_05500 [Paludibacteraceae bacterium]|nr:hypothetical protein [Paludibacteraceae bacterium]